MEMLKEKHPEIAEELTPQSEYKSMKQKMLFKNKFGLVAVNPDALMSGHCPNIMLIEKIVLKHNLNICMKVKDIFLI